VVKTGLNLHAGTAVSEIRAKSTHYRLTDENETKFYGLSRFDQSFLKPISSARATRDLVPSLDKLRNDCQSVESFE
jgi:hypothetical protein